MTKPQKHRETGICSRFDLINLKEQHNANTKIIVTMLDLK